MPILRPSETDRGRRWLTNFANGDQGAAALLLNSLHIASPTELHSGVERQIIALGDRLTNDSGVLLPVLSLEDITRALISLRSLEVGRDDEEIQRLRLLEYGGYTAWETYTPGMPISATPGSEGGIGNLVRKLTGETPGKEPGHWLHPASGLDELRDRNCRLLVLVTDYSGSGAQVNRFARTLVRNARVRSWRSSRRLAVVVVAYAMSLEARMLLDASPYIDYTCVDYPAPSFADANWTTNERAAVEGVCHAYAGIKGRDKRNGRALGFGGGGGLFATHAAVPNNVPLILRRQTPGWNAFFTGRSCPPDLVRELEGSRPPGRDLTALVAAVNQERLAHALHSGRISRATDAQLVAILALVAHSRADETLLSHRLGEPQGDVARMLAFLVRQGFVTDDFAITPAGRAELQAAKRLPRRTTGSLVPSTESYYPQSLR